MDFTATTLAWIKAFHIISVIAWMAGMLYLPRLFVYHVDAPVGSRQSETFKVMERKLLRGIINPSMILTLIFGGLLAWAYSPQIWHEGWFHAKLTLVVVLVALHGFLARWMKEFAADRNTRSAKFYRVINEVPALIVIMVAVRPF